MGRHRDEIDALLERVIEDRGGRVAEDRPADDGEIDGLEASRLIRAREARTGRRLPIVALTANAMRGDDDQCFAAGMDAYLSKPLDPEKLRAMLATVASPR